MIRALTLNLWSYNNPHDYTVRRNITRGAVPGSVAATQPALGGRSWPIRRGLIVDLLRDEQPGVAGLQEVSHHAAVEDDKNAAHQLVDALGWHAIFADGDGPAQPSGVQNGLAIISPHPLRELARLPLPDGDGNETYLFLAAEVHTPDGPIVFLTTHLALAVGEEERREHQEESVHRILTFCRTLPPDMPLALIGDMNAEPWQRPIRCLVGEETINGERGHFDDAAVLANGVPLATMPSHAPTVTLDYILVRNAEVRGRRTVGRPNADGYYPSDHLGLVAELSIARIDSGSMPRERHQSA